MISLRGLVAVVIVFLTANAATLPDCARADVQYFPIPAVSTSKNDGNDAGLVVPIMITDPDGELKYMIAPMLVHNSIVDAWFVQSVSIRPGRAGDSVYRILYGTNRAQSGLQLYRSGLQ